MKSILSGLALMVGFGLCVGLAHADKTPPEEATCGEFGTSVRFEKSPSEAAKRALKEEKLVFVLHISGHFEDSEFT